MSDTSQEAMTPPKIVWLGDDFTGAAAVMEVLTFSGVPSILFLSVPTRAQLADCPGIEAFGIATLARSQSPGWMTRHLPPLFAFLDQTGAELVHYKICSTLDSSAMVGSIGRAVDLGLARFGAATVPVVTAAPQMGRFQAFGDLHCAYDGKVYRLDRHPVMARHPVTPMTEANVARHISKQTQVPTRCVDLTALADPATAMNAMEDAEGANICTVDCLNSDHEAEIGQLLWERRRKSRFVVGSQGVEYALAAHWIATGALPQPTPAQGLGFDGRMAVVSGSVSPITAGQIDWARNNGFAAIRLKAIDVCAGPTAREVAQEMALQAARQALSFGQCPLIYTAEGPDDPFVAQTQEETSDAGQVNAMIGQALGHILSELIAEEQLKRVVVSGGDTSGHVCRALGIYALEAKSPTIPGAAICRARSKNALDGLEIALKGGQMGSQDYFGWVRDGGGPRR